MPEIEPLLTAAPSLLDWYDTHRRRLPWRETVTPYTTWISEIMLQQTRVAAVLPYYERFLAELPDVFALAEVSEDRLLKLWEGLGYYSRARNLRRAAQELCVSYGGEFPHTAAELRRLPGIGAYTAAAIASIAFGQPEPAVDGNLLRVSARVCASWDNISEASVRKTFTDALRLAIDSERPGQWNQAMMDLGAMVCLPNGTPLCSVCPLRSVCGAYRQGLCAILPRRAEKKMRRAEELTVFLLYRGEAYALRRRGDTGLLARMWEYPNVSGNLDEEAARLLLTQEGFSVKSLRSLGVARHCFTHIEWSMKCYEVEIKPDESADGQIRRENAMQDSLIWVTDGENYALPSAFRKCRERRERNSSQSGSKKM